MRASTRTRGSVTPYGDRFRARATVAGKQIHVGIFDTEEDAWSQIEAVLAEADRIAASSMPTLAQHGERWLSARETSGRVSGATSEASSWSTHVAGTSLAVLPLDAIRRRDVREWVRSVAAKRALRVVRKGARGVEYIQTNRAVSRQVVKTALRLVRGALADAVREELISENVADVDVSDLMPSNRGDEPWTILDAVEIGRLLSCEAVPVEARRIYTVAIYTGLRRGELWALRRGDVVLDEGRAELVVSRSNDNDSTKSGRTRRVPLLEPARKALLELEALPPTALLFGRDDGSMRRRDDDGGWSDIPSARGRREGHRAASGIARHVRFHDLRHTCASHLLMGTWAPDIVARPLRLEEVREWLGHSSIEVTQRYAHLAVDALQSLARRQIQDTVADNAKNKRRGSAGKQSTSTRRATQDSNQRPSASEAARNPNEHAGLQRDVLDLSSLAARVLRAIEQRDPFAIDYALELAGAVLEREAEDWSVAANRSAK